MNESTARILIVDDREENRYILSHILRRAGFRVEEVATGKDALTGSLDSPDLIVLDVKLPDISGYEVCRRIKSNPGTAGIPVLQLSANFISSESKVQALEGGADAYLTQPVEPLVFVATVKSLLRIRQAEALARTAAQQWQSTFDALSDGVALLEQDGSVAKVNRAMSYLLRRPFGQIEGQGIKLLLQQTLSVDENLDSLPSKRRSFEVQHVASWYRITFDPVLDDQGSVAGAVLVISDITQSRQIEAAMRLQDRLVSTGKLAHVIAHEINNPLEAITNLLYLLQQHAVGEGRDYVNSAQEQLERISRITKQTLEFNRESTKPAAVDFERLVDSVANLLRRDLELRSVKLNWEVNMKECEFVGYGGEVRQVLVNLVMNAADAMKDGGRIRVRVRGGREFSSGRDGVRITVADSGSGIREDIQSVIFEPFFTTKDLKGSGLGLWLSRTLILKRGGYMHFKTRTAKPSGTCFVFFVPNLDQNFNSELLTSARAG